MFDLIATLLILVGSTGYGCRLYLDHLDRIKQLKIMEQTMILMENELHYARADSLELCKSLSERLKGEFQKFFQHLYLYMKEQGGISFAQAWKVHEKDIEQISSLTKKDIEFFMNYPPTTAFLDYEMQERDSQMKREMLSNLIGQEEEKLQKNGKVYVSLGVMSGLFFVLLFL